MSIGFFFLQAGCCITNCLFLLKILFKKSCEGISLKFIALNILAYCFSLADIVHSSMVNKEFRNHRNHRSQIVLANLIINPQTYSLILTLLIGGMILFKKNVKRTYDRASDKFLFIIPVVIVVALLIIARAFTKRLHLLQFSFVFEILGMIAQVVYTKSQPKNNDLFVAVALTNLILTKFGGVIIDFLFERLVLFHIGPIILGLIGSLM